MNQDKYNVEINTTMEQAWKAFFVYRKMSLKMRADFMKAVATSLNNDSDALVKMAMAETNLPEARLKNELNRTIFQLNSYGEACQNGSWLEASVDTADPGRNPPKPDLRKMLIPLGPVVVFGASNFPFAYSTAGGDTASAFAAGCPVIVKAHPAHAKTSSLVAGIILKTAAVMNMPDGIFAHVQSDSFEAGQQLVLHPYTKAVGFTGSFSGGKALYDLANQRKEPIPVFSEMGSINPVFLLPQKLQDDHEAIAKLFAASITLSVGQFCTNPGLIIGIESDALDSFIAILGKEIKNIEPAPMLHPGIAKAYKEHSAKALEQADIELIAKSQTQAKDMEGLPTIAASTGQAFLNNPVLHQEVFGPYSLIIKCKHIAEMIEVAAHCEGQLTATLMATAGDVFNNELLVETVKNICGRFILNGVPTGVEVCLSMHHGGPYPATTDARFTSVGADAIKRFARPISYQNWDNKLLPTALQNENPLGIWRTVNNQLTKGIIIESLSHKG